MNKIVGLFLGVFAVSGNATWNVHPWRHAGAIIGLGVRANPLAGPAQSPASKPAAADSHRALLDSLGAYQGTTLIREYEPPEGGIGRQYAIDLPLDQAPAAVTEFYRKKLLPLGWQTLEERAAISAYVKGTEVFTILRAGPDDPGLPPRARLLKSAAPPADAQFFFAVEATPK